MKIKDRVDAIVKDANGKFSLYGVEVNYTLYGRKVSIYFCTRYSVKKVCEGSWQKVSKELETIVQWTQFGMWCLQEIGGHINWLEMAEDVYKQRKEEYHKKYPNNPGTAQFSSGETIWLYKFTVNGIPKGVYLKTGSSEVNLCLTGDRNYITFLRMTIHSDGVYWSYPETLHENYRDWLAIVNFVLIRIERQMQKEAKS